MKYIRSKIKKRLKKYLESDTSGIRSFVIRLLLEVKEVTVDYLYEILSKKFEVTRAAVAAMIGYIYSKLGILHAHKESYKTPTVYILKSKYISMIQSILKENPADAV